MRLRRSLFAALVLLFLSIVPALAATFPVPTGTWQQGGALATPRSFATATLLNDGRILIVGGKDANGNALAIVEVFRPDGTVASGPAMSTPRYGHSAVLLQDGRLFVAGGHTTGGTVLNTAEIFDPNANTWSSAGNAMTDPRADFTMSVVANGDVILTGGDNGTGPVASIDRFNHTTGSFQFQASLTAARKLHAASVLRDGRIVITGGSGVGQGGASMPLSLTEIYDPVANTLTGGPALNTARFANTSTTLVDGTVLIAGGNNGNADLASLEIFDPVANTMTTASATLAAARSGHVALMLPNNGSVLIAGGTSAGKALSSTELFQSWNATVLANGEMSAARQGAAASALQLDGNALVAGGSSTGTTDLYGFATVKTDAADYAPGTPVNITGTGWVPGETVTLSLLESPLFDTHPPMTAVADANGNIANSQFAPDNYDENIRFYLTATGSKSQAYNTFTDAPGQKTNTVLSVSGTQTYGQQLQFTATVTLASNGNHVISGSVAFYDGATVCSDLSGATQIGTSPLNTGGTATVSDSTLSFGNHSILACYLGSAGPPAIGSSDAVPQSITIGKASASVTPIAASKTYGTADPALTGTLTGFVPTDNITATYTRVAGETVAGGPYTISAKLSPTGVLGNYNITYNTAQFTINKANASVTPAPASKTYGTADPTLTGTLTGFVPTDNVTATYTRVAGETVTGGPYTISATLTPMGVLSNYNITYNTAAFTITKANASVTPAPASKTYGTADPALTGTLTGFVPTDNVTATYTRVAGETVGNSPYTISATLTPTGVLSNYNITYNTAVFTITKANASVTPAPASKTYGTADPALTGTLTGFLPADNVMAAYTRTAGETVTGGPYTISATLSPTGVLGNYNVAYNTASFTITPATLILSLLGSGGVYTAAPYGAVCSVASGLVNSDTVTLNVTYSSVTPPINVGTYTATCTSSGNPNYQTATKMNQIVIAPAPLTITATAQSMSFGGATPTFAATYQGFLGTDGPTVVSGLGFTTYTDTSLATAVSNFQTLKVGSYPIVPGGAVALNYSIQYVNATLTVNKAVLAGSVTITPAAPGTVAYGKPATATVYLNSYSIGGVDVLQSHNDPNNPNNPNNPLPPSMTVYLLPANGTPAQAIKFGTATAVPTYDNTKNTTGTTKTGWAVTITGNAPPPGTYNAVVYGDDPGDNSLTSLQLADTGYFFADTADIAYPTLNSNPLTVVPADLTITANNTSKTYGQTVTFQGTEFTTAGLVNSDTVTSVSLASNGAVSTATVTTPGPTYAITPSAAQGTGLSNYNITYAPGTLTVNPAALTITAKNATKTYGEVLTFAGTEFTSSGLINGDSISTVTLTTDGAAATATVVSPGPTYIITPRAATGSGLGNYNITYANGSLTVNPAALTISAKNASKTYGTTVTFAGTEFTTTGLVNSDTVASVTLVSPGAPASATVVSPGPTYAITPSAATGTGLGNYTITYANGTLTINPAALTITAKNASKNYGTALTFAGTEFTTTGLVNSDAVASVTLTSAGAPATATVVSPGPTYAITPSAAAGTGLGNYNITYTDGTLTVNPLAASVTPNAASKTYGTSDPTLTGTLVGFLPADNVTATYTRATGETVAGGPYTISATLSPAGVLGNYQITYNTALFTINKALASVTPAAASKTYGTSDPTLTGTLVGFLPADNVTATYTRTAGETVAGGPYTISATLSPSGVLSNYDITYNTAQFTINRAAASVTPNAASKTYGTSDPTLTGTLVGFLPADNVTATYTRATGETVIAGGYTISATLSPSGVLSNYDITYNTAQFTINKALASVTPAAASKTYGTVEPTLTGTLTGFVPADNVTATYSRTAGETVTGGPYTISATLSPSSVLSNYTITYNTAQFTITPAFAVVTPNAMTKVYGTADPTLTGTVSGFLLSDNVKATYSRTAGETVAGGPYTISPTLSPASALSNYTITYNTAQFTITPAHLTVTAQNKSMVYGGTLPTYTYSVTGFVNGETQATITGSPSLTTNPSAPVNVGTYTITAAPGTLAAMNNDYVFDFVNGTLSILYSTGACDGDLGHSILQPIAFNGTSTFKQGSTVPAKFRVCDANGNSVGTAGVVKTFNIIQSINGTVTDNPDVTIDSTTPDSAFRWDPTAQQWIFNISTKNLAVHTTYVFAIGLNDGSVIQFQFGLPK